MSMYDQRILRRMSHILNVKPNFIFRWDKHSFISNGKIIFSNRWLHINYCKHCFSYSNVACSAGVFFGHANVFARESAMLKPKRGGNGASQRERGGGGEREEKTPARKHCENEKHPLIRRAWPLFRKWVADNNKTTKQSLQSKDSHCLKKNKLEFIIVFILTESQCNSPQLMKLQFKLQFILLNSYL